jgi:folate-binding protein YgfZ
MTETRAYDVDRDVVIVRGPDAQSFLQSLLSQDLDPIAVGADAPALLLQPQGKLIATMFVLRTEDDTWWCVTDAGGGTALATGLNRFRIRVKAEIDEVTNDFAAVAVRGAGAEDAAQTAAVGQTRVVSAWWRGDPAFDVVGPRSDIAETIARLRAAGVELRSRDDYERARIHAGVPRLGVDIDERTIPQEAFLDDDAVSFTKGCFVGQELVCRIDTRGRVNRYLRKVEIEGDAPPAGAELVRDDKPVGTVTSAAGDVALAMVRREVEPPADVVVRWPGAEARARVESL